MQGGTMGQGDAGRPNILLWTLWAEDLVVGKAIAILTCFMSLRSQSKQLGQ